MILLLTVGILFIEIQRDVIVLLREMVFTILDVAYLDEKSEPSSDQVSCQDEISQPMSEFVQSLRLLQRRIFMVGNV